MTDNIKKKKKRRKVKKKIKRPQKQFNLQNYRLGIFGLLAVVILAVVIGVVVHFASNGSDDVVAEVENISVEQSVDSDMSANGGLINDISVDSTSEDVAEVEEPEITPEEPEEPDTPEVAKAKERIADSNALIKAWEGTWLQKIDISGDTCDYLTLDECEIMAEDTSKVKISGVIKGIPNADSDDLYLFALSTYENSIPEGAEPVDTVRLKKTEPRFSMYASLNHRQAGSRLFKKFVVAAKRNGRYQILGTSRYVTNPEAICKTRAYKKAASVKGLIVDPSKLHSGELEDLGVKQGAYNIPLGYIMGGTTFAGRPTIGYEYGGKTYAFNGQAVAEFDMVFEALSAKGIQVTAVILNNSNGAYPELIHPKSRGGGCPYYMFNGSDADGVNAMAAAATFLAERYSGAHGTISNWIIANEINATKEWNYYPSTDHYTYSDEYAKGFRVFYNAIKSVNGDAKIYMPLDQTWNRNLNNGDHDGRDVLDDFNNIISSKGNISWDLAFHSYPVPLTNAAFWNTGSFKKYTTQSVDTPMVAMHNVNIVTDYVSSGRFAKPDGSPRDVFISEVGFTSTSGEGTQAAAIAYAYYICQKNPRINGLIINRQTDSGVEIAQGLAVGLTHPNGAHKQAYNVYKHLDMADSQEVTQFALGIIGADSWSSIVRYW